MFKHVVSFVQGSYYKQSVNSLPEIYLNTLEDLIVL